MLRKATNFFIGFAALYIILLVMSFLFKGFSGTDFIKTLVTAFIVSLFWNLILVIKEKKDRQKSRDSRS